MEKLIQQITLKAAQLLEQKESIIIAIDGRCASGKTTLCGQLQRRFECDAAHMDSFFLTPLQRTAERLEKPGENVDHERFLAEVLLPIKENKKAVYRPFSCKSGGFGEPVTVSAGKIFIVEGSYSCHPTLRDFYDLKVFLTVSKQEQMERIKRRNGIDAAERFSSLWIPLEERYFEAFGIASLCDIRAEI